MRRNSVIPLTESRWLAAAMAAVCMAATAVPSSAQIRRMFDVRTPMRDGVELSADVWMPGEGGPFPTIMIRTPYLKTMAMGDFTLAGWATYFAERGYAVVIQDVRGRGDSDGAFDFFFQEGLDGYDAIEWMAVQPWSSGDVCTAGVSYLGTDQWLAAREQPPHLKCMVATAAAGRWMHELPYYGGAWMMSWALAWINGTSGRNNQGANVEGIDMESVYWHRPLLTQDDAMGRDMPLFNDFLENFTLNDYWKRLHFTEEDFRGLDLPVLHVTGWFDGDQPGAIFYWDGMMAHSPAADKQYLLSGAWTHGGTFVGGELQVGDMKLDPGSIVDNKAEHLAFFEHYLKGATDAYDQPPARIYVTGAEEWREFDEYPPAEVQPSNLYLTSGGRANSVAGDGALAWSPAADDPPDEFTFDPKRPVPAAVGLDPNGADRTPMQRRDDVLVYTSEVMEEPVEIAGRVLIEVHAASDARDTDFVANIMDVYPDGRAVKLGPVIGVVRARYRNGFESTELLTPGEVARFEIDLGHIAHSFEPGHRIRIDLTSSAYPHIAPNQNTGNPVATDTEWNTARQTIFHNLEYRSRIILPVLGRRRATEE